MSLLLDMAVCIKGGRNRKAMEPVFSYINIYLREIKHEFETRVSNSGAHRAADNK